jgi:hypothetical protein
MGLWCVCERGKVETKQSKSEEGQGRIYDLDLTFCESHCRPSKRPSPVVAQLRERNGKG